MHTCFCVAYVGVVADLVLTHSWYSSIVVRVVGDIASLCSSAQTWRMLDLQTSPHLTSTCWAWPRRSNMSHPCCKSEGCVWLLVGAGMHVHRTGRSGLNSCALHFSHGRQYRLCDDELSRQQPSGWHIYQTLRKHKCKSRGRGHGSSFVRLVCSKRHWHDAALA